MRTDSKNSEGPGRNLHYHDGSTCHGCPTLNECATTAIANGWIGKVLEIEDTYQGGASVKCYSLVAGSFEHHAKHGRYVAEVKLVAVLLT